MASGSGQPVMKVDGYGFGTPVYAVYGGVAKPVWDGPYHVLSNIVVSWSGSIKNVNSGRETQVQSLAAKYEVDGYWWSGNINMNWTLSVHVYPPYCQANGNLGAWIATIRWANPNADSVGLPGYGVWYRVTVSRTIEGGPFGSYPTVVSREAGPTTVDLFGNPYVWIDTITGVSVSGTRT